MISGGTASPDNVIQGNLVGTNPTGMVGLSNGTGIEVVNAPRTIIGGPGTARNVISGNQASFGISLRASTTDAVVANNYIGLNAAGTGAIPNRTGLSISDNSDDTTVGGATAGLGNVISGNTDFGILVSTASIRTRIFGNLIGTNATGTLPVANGTGIFVSGVSGTIIGGSTVAARNVVSGNTASGILLSSETGTLIRGNYIGVRADGGAAIPNGGDGVRLTAGATGNSIGSAQSGGGNLISGNTGNGISLSATTVNGNEILGNRIGTDDLSTTSIPNGLHGISISDASANIIGGVAPAARNVISGNLQNGVSISGAAATGNLIASNFIGTNGSGMSAIPNNVHGVVINSSSGNTIGTPDAGNVISGNGQNGIAVLGASSSANQIYANRIGVNALSTSAVGNLQDGIRIEGAASTVIGGVGLARNTIGGNALNGIGIYSSTTGAAAPGTQIIGNAIGFRSPPNTVGNGLSGIHLGFATNTIIGGDTQDATNLISQNGRNGVSVSPARTTRSTATKASATTRSSASTSATTASRRMTQATAILGPNNLQNFPVLTGVVGGVTGTLNSTPGSGFLIEYYGNAACDVSQHGEGETFLGSALVLTDANGNATIPLFPVAAGQVVTATATSGNGDGDTSEFSACVTVPAGTAVSADLTLTMTDSSDPVPFGTAFNYVSMRRTSGRQPATDVHVTDTLPAGLQFQAVVVDYKACAPSRPGGHVRIGTPRASAALRAS